MAQTQERNTPPSQDYHVVFTRDKNIIDERARDMGFEQLEEKRRKSRIKKFLLYNRFPEFFKQKEILAARKKLETGNIYADVTDDTLAHQQAIESTLKRFGSELDDALILRNGENRRAAERAEKQEVARIIFNYVSSPTPKPQRDKALKESVNHFISQLYGGQIAGKKDLIGENVLDIATAMRASGTLFDSIRQVESLLTITIGEANTGIATESHQTETDKFIQRVCESSPGKYIPKGAVVLGVGIASAVATNFLNISTRSALVAGGGLAGVFAAGAIIGGLKGRVQFEQQLRQHQRDLTLGKKAAEGETKGLRAEAEKKGAVFNMREAGGETGIIATLQKNIDAYRTDPSQENMSNLLDIVTETTARTQIASYGFYQDKQKIRAAKEGAAGPITKVELIQYTHITTYSQEKDQIDTLKGTAIELLRSQATVQNSSVWRAMRFMSRPDFNEFFTGITQTHIDRLIQGEGEAKGIQETIARINTMRRSKALKLGTVSGITALAGNVLTQEAIAMFSPKTVGVVDELTSRRGVRTEGKSLTALEQIVRWLKPARKEPLSSPLVLDHSVDPATSHAILQHSEESLRVQQTPAGDYEISGSGVYVPHVKINENGTLSPESATALHEAGINIRTEDIPVKGQNITRTMPVREFLSSIKENRASIYHGSADAVKYIDNVFSTEDIVYKHGEQFNWSFEGGSYVAKLPLPKPDERGFGDLDIASEKNVLNNLKLLLHINTDAADRVIEVPVKVVGDHFEAQIPTNHPGAVLFEQSGGGVNFKGSGADLAYAGGHSHNGSMSVYQKFLIQNNKGSLNTITESFANPRTETGTRVILELKERGGETLIPVGTMPTARDRTLNPVVNKNKPQSKGRNTEYEAKEAFQENKGSEIMSLSDLDPAIQGKERRAYDRVIIAAKEYVKQHGNSPESIAAFVAQRNAAYPDTKIEAYEVNGKVTFKITHTTQSEQSGTQSNAQTETNPTTNPEIFIAETNSTVILNQEFITKQFTALQDLNLSPDLTNEGRNLILTINGWLAAGANDGNSNHKIASDIRAWYAWLEKHTPHKTESTPEVEQPPTPSREEQFASIRDALNEAYESVFDQIPEGTEKQILEINLNSLYQTDQETLPTLYFAGEAARQVLEKYVPEGTLPEFPAENELFAEEFKKAREYLQQATNGTLKTRIAAAAPNADKAIADQMHALHNKLNNLAKKQGQLNLRGIVNVIETSQHLEDILSKAAQPVEEKSQVQTQTTQERTPPPPPAPPHRTADQYQVEWGKRTQKKSTAAPVVEVNQISAQELAEFYSKQLPQLSKTSLIKIESLPNGKDLLKQTDAHIPQLLNHKDAFAHVSEIIATVDGSSQLLLKHDGHNAQFVWEVPVANKDFSVDKALGALNGTEILQDAGTFLNTSFESGIIARKDRAGSRIKNLSSAEKQTYTNLWVQWTSQKTAFDTLARTAMDGITVSTAKDIVTAAQALETTTKKMEQLGQPKTVGEEPQNASGNTYSNTRHASQEEKVQTYAKLSIILEKWQEEVADPLGIKLGIAEADKNTEAVMKNIDIISKNLITMRVYSKNLVNCAEVRISSQVSQLSWSKEKSRRTLLVPMDKEVTNDEAFTFFYGPK